MEENIFRCLTSSMMEHTAQQDSIKADQYSKSEFPKPVLILSSSLVTAREGVLTSKCNNLHTCLNQVCLKLEGSIIYSKVFRLGLLGG